MGLAGVWVGGFWFSTRETLPLPLSRRRGFCRRLAVWPFRFFLKLSFYDSLFFFSKSPPFFALGPSRLFARVSAECPLRNPPKFLPPWCGCVWVRAFPWSGTAPRFVIVALSSWERPLGLSLDFYRRVVGCPTRRLRIGVPLLCCGSVGDGPAGRR